MDIQTSGIFYAQVHLQRGVHMQGDFLGGLWPTPLDCAELTIAVTAGANPTPTLTAQVSVDILGALPRWSCHR